METRDRKPLNLALQGGGSHGAFTWGVLDRLLEEDCFDFEGIVGTSAGAMNAVSLAYGLRTGGAEGARACLADYWRRNMKMGAHAPWPSPMDRMFGDGNLTYSPMFQMLDALSRVASPYQLNPTGFNPLEKLVENMIDFDVLRDTSAGPRLYLCATNVMNGRAKVFEGAELSAKAVAASACLPFMFQAVEIDGNYYWDGGYMGNPPLFPILYNCECRDLLVVQVTPVNLPELPTDAAAIFDRITGLSFNSSLMREMRVVKFVSDMIQRGNDDGGRLREAFIHTIDAEERMGTLGASSQANLDKDYIDGLFALGREKGAHFIEAHFDAIGRESTTDIEEKFM